MALKRSTETTSTDVMNQNNGRLMRLIDQAIKEVLFDMNNPFKDEYGPREITIKLKLKASDVAYMIVNEEVKTKLAPFDRTPEADAPEGQMNIFTDFGDLSPSDSHALGYNTDEDLPDEYV